MSLIKKIASKIRREGTDSYRSIRLTAGLDNAVYRQARGSRIVTYHGICLKDHTRYNPIFLTARMFEDQLRYFKKFFNVVSLDELYAGELSSDKFNICLTFDDGFANNYKYVLPLLEQYGMPATFFITAARKAGYDILWNDFLNIASKHGPAKVTVGGQRYYKGQYHHYYHTSTHQSLKDRLRNKNFEAKASMMKELAEQTKTNWQQEADYWLLMDEKQIRTMAASPYVTIGAHGFYHNDLTKLTPAERQQELYASKTWLETLTGRHVNSLAFPYGSYDADTITDAKNAGYTQLLALDFLLPQDATDPTMRERQTVNPFISTGSQLRAIVTNRYD